MIFKAENRIKTSRSQPMGGEGEINGLASFNADTRPEKTCFKMVSRMSLEPGSSVGPHVHKEDEELYLIVSGQGLYIKNDGSAEPVGPGDLTMTRKGERHGLENTGPEPLVFIAVIGV